MTVTSDRKRAALQDLSRLAAALHQMGFATDLYPDRQPFAGLAVRIPDGIAMPAGSAMPAGVVTIPAGVVMVLAGTAHFWRQKSDGDLQLIGPLDVPARAAATIRNGLGGKKARQ